MFYILGLVRCNRGNGDNPIYKAELVKSKHV